MKVYTYLVKKHSILLTAEHVFSFITTAIIKILKQYVLQDHIICDFFITLQEKMEMAIIHV